MTIRGEYVHIDLGTVELNTVYSDGGPYNLRSRVSMGTARIGVNFRF